MASTRSKTTRRASPPRPGWVGLGRVHRPRRLASNAATATAATATAAGT